VELYNYKLENIDLSGDVKDQIFDGNLELDDKNISLFFNGLVDFSDDLVDFDFDLDLLKADLNNINDEYDNSISGSANVKLRGSRIENLIGDLSINNLKFKNSNINTEFEKFDAQLRYNDDIRIVNFELF
jgi:autotransporter translocation and assembly factor TamB